MPHKDPIARQAYQIAWVARNREKANAVARAYAQKPENKQKQRSRHRLRTYNLTDEQLQQMYDAQGGRCRICGCQLDLSSRNTHVDHNHKTGEIRALLCHGCNIGLFYVENAQFRLACLHYLEVTSGAP